MNKLFLLLICLSSILFVLTGCSTEDSNDFLAKDLNDKNENITTTSTTTKTVTTTTKTVTTTTSSSTTTIKTDVGKDACGVLNGDGSSCADACGVPYGDGTSCLPPKPGQSTTQVTTLVKIDACGVPNGDGSSCADACGVPYGDGTSCIDACGILNGDGSSCADACGVPYGDGTSCTDTNNSWDTLTAHTQYNHIYYTCNTNGKMIALTFDDGPNDGTIPVVEALDRLGVKATFFLNGGNPEGQLDNYRAGLLKAFESGHQIAHHTWSHASIYNINDFTREIDHLKNEVERILGPNTMTPYFRPPYGHTDDAAQKEIHNRGYAFVKWDGDADTNDWQMWSWEHQLDVILKKINQGQSFIHLSHDREAGTTGFLTHALPKIVEEGKKMGFSFVTISECLQ